MKSRNRTKRRKRTRLKVNIWHFDYIDDNNDNLYGDPTWQNVPDDMGKLSVSVKTLSLIFF